ncbi:MAG TPA: hypothetical protein VLM79_22885, partial [Kofleriaceae bacterium]|nr:hypothetical protein [Kofleriaceae bacterium]
MSNDTKPPSATAKPAKADDPKVAAKPPAAKPVASKPPPLDERSGVWYSVWCKVDRCQWGFRSRSSAQRPNRSLR